MKNSNNTRDYLFVFGSIIILVGFLVCLTVWLWIFGIIIFFIGSVIVSISKASLEKKVLVITVPLIIYYPLVYLYIYIFNWFASK